MGLFFPVCHGVFMHQNVKSIRSAFYILHTVKPLDTMNQYRGVFNYLFTGTPEMLVFSCRDAVDATHRGVEHVFGVSTQGVGGEHERAVAQGHMIEHLAFLVAFHF